MSSSAASTYWSALNTRGGYAANWYSFCGGLINERITGSAALAPSIWVLTKVAKPPVQHLLEIGCLEGKKVAGAVTKGLAQAGSGLDIAAEAIKRGQKQHPNLNLFVADLNKPELPRAKYDVIIANGVLHHIENLEICVQALYDALMPGGVLAASEFTGPRRYAYSSKEVRLINEGVKLLPRELQHDFSPSSLASKLAADPSESVRTRDMEAVLRATFDQVEARPYGGNVLMRGLSARFFEKFDTQSAAHQDGLASIVAFDTEVSAREPSHHTYFIASKAA